MNIILSNTPLTCRLKIYKRLNKWLMLQKLEDKPFWKIYFGTILNHDISSNKIEKLYQV